MKKTVSILLAAILLLSCVPCGALAEGITIIGGSNSGIDIALGGKQEFRPEEKIKKDGECFIPFNHCYCFADAMIYKTNT